MLPLFGSPFPIETNNSEAAADWTEIFHIFCEEKLKNFKLPIRSNQLLPYDICARSGQW